MADIATQIKDLEAQINDGVIEGKRDSDYVAGVLPYQVRNLAADWQPYLPAGEKQYNNAGDSMSCVSFATTSSIETQEKFLTGWSANYSDRWVAKMSGTTKDGNYLYKVADAIRDYGLVWEEHYPAPAGLWTFDEWIADIPLEKLDFLKTIGKQWKNYWSIAYEWVDVNATSLVTALRHAPLVMIIPGHAVEAVYKPADLVTFFDTYIPYIRAKPLSAFTSAFKVVLTPLKGQIMGNSILVKKGNEYGFYVPAINPSALISLGLNFGLDIPKNPDGSVAFAEVDKLVRGNLAAW